jgi:3-oxoacyl-[acyl-carrier protein] reductase
LSSAGARIALTGTNNEKLNNLLMELGSSHSAHSCDLSKFEEIDKLSDTVIEEFGSIDILINNAGVKKDDLLIRMKDDDWFNVININLNSVYKLTKNISKHMFKKRSGKIISISSVVGFSGNPGQTNYVSSKAALVGFTKSLAMEVATRGINVNCIAPGMIDSEMIDSLNEKQKENILSRIPMAKLGSPEDIANACLFLGSDMSNYITGQTIHVNGGMAML